MTSLEPWIEAQYGRASTAMLRSISAVELSKTRPGFGQQIRCRPGAIIASPVLAAYDPDPDYFFHWYRDSAIVMDALRLLHEDGSLGAAAIGYLADFVHFSNSLRSLDGRELVAAPAWRSRVTAQFQQFLRPDAELAAVHGEAVAAETRVNPDGSLDISNWGRPQHDGPALRALTLLRWQRSTLLDRGLAAALAELLRADIAYVRRHWQEPCFDIWEEEKGLHYYTLRVSAAALDQASRWLESRGEHSQAEATAAEAATIQAQLEAYWLAEAGYYRSRILASGTPSPKDLDIAVILAALHAGDDAASHSPGDARSLATLDRLATMFDAAYAINRDRPATRQPAMGRYAGDIYYSGGAYYFSSLGAAEFCYRAARIRALQGGADSRQLLHRGDGFLETVRLYTPPGGELSEQFDQNTGAQSSARHLAWSYAAFITCVCARRTAMAG
jgi:glucoamylase